MAPVLGAKSIRENKMRGENKTDKGEYGTFL